MSSMSESNNTAKVSVDIRKVIKKQIIDAKNVPRNVLDWTILNIWLHVYRQTESKCKLCLKKIKKDGC